MKRRMEGKSRNPIPVSLFLILCLLLSACPCLGDDGGLPADENIYYDGTYYYYDEPGSENSPAPVLLSLTHSCASTGVQLPAAFDPYTTSYLLTVASWVNRVSFTPVASDPSAAIEVDGSIIRSGSSTSYFKLDDQPRQVDIQVSNRYGSTRYTVFLQRRPSERRTRVSAGSVNRIYQSGSKWYIDADLGTVTYADGNLSTYLNKAKESYKYPCAANCVFYFGDIAAPIRAFSVYDFNSQYDPDGLYRFIYIEDEIVAVLPYSPDF